MRSKSTLFLIGFGCLLWYAVNREALEAMSSGESATLDMWFPFLTGFAIAALIRAAYRKASGTAEAARSKKETESEPTDDTQIAPKPGPVDRPNAADQDPEVLRLREQLAKVEQKAEEQSKAKELERQRAEKAQQVDALTRELANAEAKLAELKKDAEDL